MRGLINIQFVIKDGRVYATEANPRASRTVPYLSKAIGHPLAKYAALIAAGRTLSELGFTSAPRPEVYSVKEAVLPFLKFSGVLPVLGPEMRSTGESMGIDTDPHLAFHKAALGAGSKLPSSGRALLIGGDLESETARLTLLGFSVELRREAQPGDPLIGEADYDLLIDVAQTRELRRALENGVPYVSTREAARWTIDAITAAAKSEPRVTALQDLY